MENAIETAHPDLEFSFELYVDESECDIDGVLVKLSKRKNEYWVSSERKLCISEELGYNRLLSLDWGSYSDTEFEHSSPLSTGE